MKKMNILRGIALLLAAIMIFTSVPETALTAYAIEEEAAGTETPAAVEPTVEQAGTGEEVQATTPEAVEPETTDEIQVNEPDAADEIQPVEAAPEVNSEEVNVNGATSNARTLSVQQTTTGSLSNLAYGVAINDLKYSVTAIEQTSAAYSKFSYKWYTATDKTSAGDTAIQSAATVSAKLALMTETALPVGLTSSEKVSTDEQTEIVISGTPTQYAAADTYYLVVSDEGGENTITSGSTSTTYTEADDAILVVANVSVGKASVSAPTTTLTFGPAVNGYTTNTTSGANNVVPQTIEITAPYVKEAAKIQDLKYTIVTSNSASGTAETTKTYNVTADKDALYDESKITLSIAPMTGLSAGSTGSNTVDRWLVISSENGNFDPIVVPLTFTVTSDLAWVSISQGTNVKKAADTSVAFAVTKGVALTEDKYIKATATGIGIKDMAATNLPAGLQYTWTKTTKDGIDTAVLTVTGTATGSTSLTVSFTVTNNDGETKTFTYDTNQTDVTVNVNAPDLTYTIGNEAIVSTGKHTWYAVLTDAGDDGTYETYTGTNVAVAFRINNPTTIDQTVTLALDASTKFEIRTGSVSGTIVTDGSAASTGIEIKAGNYADFYIVPTGPISVDTTSSTWSYTDLDGTITVANTVGGANGATLNLEVVGIPTGTSSITYPVNAGTWKAGVVNEAYDETPVLEGTYRAGTWSLEKAGDESGETSHTNDISAAKLLSNYGLNFNAATGRIYGTPKKAGKIYMTLKCNYVDEDYDQVQVTLDINSAKADSLQVQKDGVEIADTYKLPTVAAGDTSTVASLDLANLMTVDATGLTAKITKIEGPSALSLNSETPGDDETIGKYFDAYNEFTSGTLSAGMTKAFGFRKADTYDSEPLVAGTYTITMTITSDNVTSPVATQVFKLEVGATPTIEYTNFDGTTGQITEAKTFDVGTVFDHDAADKTNKKHTFTVDTPASRSMTWSISEGTLPAGLYLDSATGQIYGTATTSGSETFTVRGYDAVSGYAGTLELTYTVRGTSEVSSITFIQNSATKSLLNNEYIFDYSMVNGDAPESVDVTLKSGATEATGWIYIDILGEGKDHFGVNYSKIKGLTKTGETLNFYAKKTAKSGEYNATVKVYGAEIAPVYFYLHHTVVGELVIDNYYDAVDKTSVSSYEGTIGKAMTYKDSNGSEIDPILAVATAGNIYQHIDITEVVGKNTTSNLPAGTLRNGDGDGTDKKNGDNGVPTYSRYAYSDDNTPNKAGTYTVTLKATAIEADYKTVTDPFNTDAAAIANTGFKVYPKQESGEVTVTFEIAKGDLVKIKEINSTANDSITVGTSQGNTVTKSIGAATLSEVGSEVKIATLNGQFFGTDDWTVDVKADTGETTADYATFPANLDANFDRNGDLTKINGYNFITKDVGYAAETLTVTLDNSGAAADSTITLGGGTSSNFVLGGLTSGKLSVPGGNTATFTIAPKGGLAADTYTDTVTIAGDNANTITFNVSFTVNAADYALEVTSADMLEVDEGDAPKVNTLLEKGKGGIAADTAYLYAKKGTSTAAAYSLPITVKNVGNQDVAITAYEVADAAGTDLPGNSPNTKLAFTDTETSGSISASVHGVENKLALSTSGAATAVNSEETIYVVPKDVTAVTTSAVTAYIKFVFASVDGKTTDFVVVPVNYIIYDTGIALTTAATGDSSNGVTVDDTAGTIGVTAISEEIAGNPSQMNARKVEIKATNGVTTSTAVTSYIYNMSAKLSNAAVDGVTIADADISNYFSLTCAASDRNTFCGYKQVAPGGSNAKTFTLVPVAGLPAGEYTATLTIDGNNVASAKTYAVTYTVGKTAEEKATGAFDVYTGVSEDAVWPAARTDHASLLKLAPSQAQMLWNTLVIGNSELTLNGATVTKTTGDIYSTTGAIDEYTVTIAKDGQSFTIVFDTECSPYTVADTSAPTTTTWTLIEDTTTPNGYMITGINGATISKAYDSTVGEIEIGTSGVTAHTATDTTGAEMVQRQVGTYGNYTTSVTFTPKSWLLLDAGTGKFNSTKAALENATKTVVTDAEAATDDVTKIYVLLENGEALSTKLPTVPAVSTTGKKAGTWANAAATIGNSTITKDTKWTPTYGTYNWPAYNAEEGIVWTWAADNTGASVTLTLTSTDTPAQTATLTGTYGDITGDIKIKRTAQEPSCELGEGYKYEAEINSTSDWYTVLDAGVNNYTDVKYTGEDTGATGHTWDYSSVRIKSVKADSTLEIEAEAVCTVCDEKKEVKYVIEEDIEDPKCTTPGFHYYGIKYYLLDKEGNSTSKTDYGTPKFVEIQPKGHTYTTLNVDWKYDEKTGEITGVKNAYVICDVCGERTEVSSNSYTYKADDGNGNATVTATIGNQTLTATSSPVADEDCTFSEPSWTWNADNTVATATFTRSYQGKVLDTKTYSATSTPAVKIERTVAQLYTVYTASVDINGKTYSSTIKNERDDVTAGENGTEDGYIEFFFDGYAYGDDVHVTYNGAKQTPRVIVVNGSKQLVEGVDYTVTYKNNIKASVNTKAGVATATIKGKGNYTGTDSTLTFIIDPVDISDEDLVHVSGNAGVAGKAIKPILTFGGKALGAKDSDIASQFKALGKLTAAADGKTVTVTGKGNFKGTLDVEVSVLTKAELIPIKVASMTLKSTPYTGEPITLDSDQDSDTVNLKVVAKTTGETLYENDNYTVSYSNNVNAGTVKVVIAGIAPYTGKITKSFKITPAKAANLVVENRENLTGSFKRTGATPSEALQIVDETNNIGLVNGRDYTIKYKNNKKVGTATAVVTYKGNYKGHAKDNVTFTVTPAVFNKNGVDEETTIKSKVVWNTTKATAKGKYYTPAPQIMIDGVLLTSKEYTAVYTNADTGAVITSKTVLSMPTAEKPINVNVTVTPKSTNYTTDGYDPIVLSYQIVAPSGIALNGAKLAVMTTNAKGKTVKLNAGYTGEPITFWSDDVNSQGFLQLTIGKGKSATVLTGAQIEEKFDIQYVNNVQKGTATVIITPNDDTYSGSVVGTFKIKAGLINWIKK